MVVVVVGERVGLDGQEKVSFVCGYKWALQVRILEVPQYSVVRYESSPAKLNRLGRMQVRDKAKAGLGAAGG